MTTQNKTVRIPPAYQYDIRAWINFVLRRISTSTKQARHILDEQFKTELKKSFDTIDKTYGAIPYGSEKRIDKIPAVELGFLEALTQILNKYIPQKFHLTAQDLINYPPQKLDTDESHNTEINGASTEKTKTLKPILPN